MRKPYTKSRNFLPVSNLDPISFNFFFHVKISTKNIDFIPPKSKKNMTFVGIKAKCKILRCTKFRTTRFFNKLHPNLQILTLCINEVD